MQQDSTGQVIPFPLERIRTRDGGSDRLAAALDSLEAALAEQRAAMTGFRESLGQLGAAVHALEGGAVGLSTRLGALHRQVGTVNQSARDLEAWADRVLARAR
jgi:ABC-type transporter Mla subunit MlaD